jgi:hypothetical protein
MNLRARPSASIRVDALRMATKKIASGCTGCGESYIELARKHGATEGEIAAAKIQVAPVSSAGSINISENSSPRTTKIWTPSGGSLRRNASRIGISIAAAAGAVSLDNRLAFAGGPKKGRSHPPPPPKVWPDPFGVDGATSPGIGGMPTNFYIAEMGFGLYSNCGPCANGTTSGCPSGGACGSTGTACFVTSTANAAGIYYTHGYWGLQGPGVRGSYGPYAWGKAQAQAAVNAWLNGPYATYIYGQTIFADVEGGFCGWNSGSAYWSDNQNTLNGFLTYIAGQTQYGLNPGVYINTGDVNGPNNAYFGPSYTPSKSFVFWPTGTVCGVGECGPAVNGCAPCNPNCNTLTPVINNWNAHAQYACFAGQGSVVWQFWISGCGCGGDFDYSPQSGYVNFNAAGCSGSCLT